MQLLAAVAIFDDLPIIGNTIGDVRTVRSNGIEYYWSINSAGGALADWKPVKDGYFVNTTENYPSGYQPKTIVLENPSNTENIGIISPSPIPATITEIVAVVSGAAPTLDFNIEYGQARDALTRKLFAVDQTISSEDSGTIFRSDSFDDPSIEQDDYVVFTTSAKTGVVSRVELTVRFSRD